MKTVELCLVSCPMKNIFRNLWTPSGMTYYDNGCIICQATILLKHDTTPANYILIVQQP